MSAKERVKCIPGQENCELRDVAGLKVRLHKIESFEDVLPVITKLVSGGRQAESSTRSLIRFVTYTFHQSALSRANIPVYLFNSATKCQ